MVLGRQSKTDLQRLQTEAETIGVEGRNWIVYSQLLLTMFLWGLAWPVGRLLATNLPPVSIAVLRYTIVVPVLFGILRLKGQSLRIERKWILNLVVMGLFSTTLYQIFFLYGVRYAAASDDSLVIGIGPVLVAIIVGYFFYVVGVSKIGAGRAAIFGNLVPVFGVITSVLLLRENLSPWHGVSFLLILTGVVLVNRQRKKTSETR